RFPINQEYHTSGQFTCAEELIYKQYSWLQLVITAVPSPMVAAVRTSRALPAQRTASAKEPKSR
ncbi:hypothetical protein, partial [Nostoc sp.]